MCADPHAAQQAALVRRICNSAERLAEVVEEINFELAAADEESYKQVEHAQEVWTQLQAKMRQSISIQAKLR